MGKEDATDVAGMDDSARNQHLRIRTEKNRNNMPALWKTAFPKQARKLARHSTLTRKKRESKARSDRFSKRKPVNPVSKRRQDNLKLYATIKRQWKSEPQNQRCIINQTPNPEIHHTWGRIGELLCLSRLWVGVARKVHDFIRDNPKLAAKAGLLCPAGRYNSIPNEFEIRAQEYRLFWLRCIVHSDESLRPVRPPLLATAVCVEVERDMEEVAATKFWLKLK
jgi:hypothetical protein